MSLSTQEIDDAHGQSWSQVADDRLRRATLMEFFEWFGGKPDMARGPEVEDVDEFMAQRNQSTTRK